MTSQHNLTGRKLHSKTRQHDPKWRAPILRFHSEQGCHDDQGVAPEDQEEAGRWEVRVGLHQGNYVISLKCNQLKHTCN